MLKIISIVDTKAMDINEAIKLGFPDFEDAVVSTTVSRENCSYIVTRNTGDYKKSPVPVISPKEFLKFITKKNE